MRYCGTAGHRVGWWTDYAPANKGSKRIRKVETETIMGQMSTIVLQITCQFWCNLSAASLSLLNQSLSCFLCARRLCWHQLSSNSAATLGFLQGTPRGLSHISHHWNSLFLLIGCLRKLVKCRLIK